MSYRFQLLISCVTSQEQSVIFIAKTSDRQREKMEFKTYVAYLKPYIVTQYVYTQTLIHTHKHTSWQFLANMISNDGRKKQFTHCLKVKMKWNNDKGKNTL